MAFTANSARATSAVPRRGRRQQSRLFADVATMVREQRDYAELLRVLVRRDLTVRYRNSTLGFAWAVITPLLQMLLFTLIFTRLAPLETGVPYPVYAYTGLLVWTWFASSLRFAAISLTVNPNLVTKVYFPREVLPFSSVIVAFVDLLVASVVLAGLLAYFGGEPSWPMLAFPVLIAIQFTLTAACALAIAMLHLLYSDVKYVFELFLLLWMFASSVLYPVDRIGGFAGALLQQNPMTILIDAYRAVLLHATWPWSMSLLAVGCASLLLLGVIWLTFHRAEPRFAEEI